VLSALKGEAEVLLFPGSTFAVLSVAELGGPAPSGPLAALYAAIQASSDGKKLKAARNCYLVHAQMLPAPPVRSIT
jgi:hypothetical protein